MWSHVRANIATFIRSTSRYYSANDFDFCTRVCRGYRRRGASEPDKLFPRPFFSACVRAAGALGAGGYTVSGGMSVVLTLALTSHVCASLLHAFAPLQVSELLLLGVSLFWANSAGTEGAFFTRPTPAEARASAHFVVACQRAARVCASMSFRARATCVGRLVARDCGGVGRANRAIVAG
jgi:hypothetical protein